METLRTVIGPQKLQLVHADRNAGLDGLRAVAALMVVSSHTIIPSYYGSFAVWLFFTLSGYLLGSQLLAKESWAGSVIPVYLARRVLRIYPLYAFVVVSSAIAGRNTSIFGYEWTVDHLLFIRGEGYLWTVKQEVLFYFLLPGILLVLVPLRKSPLLSCAVLVCAALAAQRYLTIDVASLSMTPTSVTDIKIAPFIFGVAAAYLARTDLLDRIPPHVVQTIGVLLVLIALCILPPPFWRTLGTVEPLIDIAMAGIVLLTHRGLMGPLQLVLSSRPAQLLGVIGYGFYLWHWPVELAVSRFEMTNHVAKMICVVAATIPIAAITYIAIERPFMRIRLGSSSLEIAARPST